VNFVTQANPEPGNAKYFRQCKLVAISKGIQFSCPIYGEPRTGFLVSRAPSNHPISPLGIFHPAGLIF